MGLLKSDKLPVGYSLVDAYTAIRQWYQNNVGSISLSDLTAKNNSRILIQNLPKASVLTGTELQAVLIEVLHGSLEWAYHKDDVKFKMGAYAQEGLKTAKFSDSLNQDEIRNLHTSSLWRYLTPGLKSNPTMNTSKSNDKSSFDSLFE